MKLRKLKKRAERRHWFDTVPAPYVFDISRIITQPWYLIKEVALFNDAGQHVGTFKP